MDLKAIIGILKIGTTAMTGLFTGGAVFTNIVSIPSMRTIKDDAVVSKYWKDFLHRATTWQDTLICTSMVTSGVIYMIDDSDTRYLWLVGPGLLVTGVPWTLLVMKPDSDKLLEDDVIQKRGGDWVRTKLESWNKKHMYRSFICLSVFGIFLYTLRS